MSETEAPAGIGHNSGEDKPQISPAIARLNQMIEVANKWVTERPKIENQEMADKAGAFLRQARTSVTDAERERKDTNRPLDEQIKANNKVYAAITETLDKLSFVINGRLNAFATKLREEQEAIAKAAREAAAAAAAEAEVLRLKQEETLKKAEAGELVGKFDDVAKTTQETREAEQRAKQLERDASAAEKLKPKFGGEHFTDGSRRSLTQRTVETPIVEQAGLVLRAVGTNDQINAALITAARAYKKLKGRWPAGIKIETTTTTR